MAKKPLKKVIVKKQKQSIKPTVSKTQSANAQTVKHTLIFGPKNYKFMLIGIALIVVGCFLMSGGSMPSPEIWDDSIIYSFRRVTLAPIFILAGLAVEIYAIFK